MTNLEDKLKALETQREQTIANVHAINGAIELLKQLIAEQSPAPAPNDDKPAE